MDYKKTSMARFLDKNIPHTGHKKFLYSCIRSYNYSKTYLVGFYQRIHIVDYKMY